MRNRRPADYHLVNRPVPCFTHRHATNRSLIKKSSRHADPRPSSRSHRPHHAIITISAAVIVIASGKSHIRHAARLTNEFVADADASRSFANGWRENELIETAHISIAPHRPQIDMSKANER